VGLLEVVQLCVQLIKVAIDVAAGAVICGSSQLTILAQARSIANH
jgi:hypothetical protein